MQLACNNTLVRNIWYCCRKNTLQVYNNNKYNINHNQVMPIGIGNAVSPKELASISFSSATIFKSGNNGMVHTLNNIQSAAVSGIYNVTYFFLFFYLFNPLTAKDNISCPGNLTILRSEGCRCAARQPYKSLRVRVVFTTLCNYICFNKRCS